MTAAQKVIKAFAYGLAAVIAFSIMAAIVAAGAGILTAVGIINGKAPETISCESYEKCLNLELSYSELYIKKGEKLEIETSDDNYEITKEENKLVVKDKKKASWFGSNGGRKVTVTVPSDMVFDAVGIGNGAGKIEISYLYAKELTLSVGAGETIIDEMKVTKKAEISTGAGRFEIKNGVKINDAKVSLGVGETKIRAALTGEAKIDAGVGSVDLELLMLDSDYKIKVDKGIGEIRFNGESVGNGTYGKGENVIDIDGGIGGIKIKTATESVMPVVEKTEDSKVEEKAEDEKTEDKKTEDKKESEE